MGIKVISKNRKAFHDYQMEDAYEAGIQLQGTEVKALRAAKVNLGGGWVDLDRHGQAWLKEVHIGHYSHGNIQNHEEMRPRRLLLHKREIIKLQRAVEEKGFSVVPSKIYFKKSLIKVEICLAKGKQMHDKRESSKAKDAKKDMARALKNTR